MSYQFKEFDELINSAIQDEVIPDIGSLGESLGFVSFFVFFRFSCFCVDLSLL